MSTAYVVYRVTVAVLMVAWVIADFLYEAGRFYRHNYAIWLVFATNWSMLAVCITTIWMAVTSVYYYYGTRYRSLGTFSIYYSAPVLFSCCMPTLSFAVFRCEATKLLASPLEFFLLSSSWWELPELKPQGGSSSTTGERRKITDWG